MRYRVLLAVVGSLTLPTQLAHAQRLAAPWPSPSRSLAAHNAAFSQPLDLRISPQSLAPPWTHATVGAVIGGIVVGFVGAITGVGLCHFDAPCPHPAPFAIGGFVLGALAGGGIGYRIGDAFSP